MKNFDFRSFFDNIYVIYCKNESGRILTSFSEALRKCDKMYNALLVLQVLAVIITVICVCMLGFERTNIQQKLLMMTIICAFIYCLGYTVEIIGVTYSQAIAALKVEYVGASFLVTCYVAFLVKYFKKQHNRLIFTYFFVIDVLVLISVLRLEVSNWYYHSLGFSNEGLFPHIVIERGPLYYIFFANNVVMVLYGFMMVIQELKRQRNPEIYVNSPIKKRTLILILITTMIPFLPYTLSSMGISDYFDFVPLSFLVSAVTLLVIVLRDNIFDVVTGAHEQMLSSMHDAIIIVNHHMEFLEANKAALRIFPSLFNYQIEKKCPEDVIRIFENLESDEPIVIKDRVYERHSSKVYKERNLIGYSVLLIDITDSNELMNQLREMKNQADQANKAKSTFLANVSHELRTPLNAVIGYSDLIIQETNNRVEEDHAYAIRKAADSLLSIINTILDISKIESGKIDIVRAPYNTMDLINGVINIISIPAQKKGLDLIVDIDRNLPSSLYGDCGHIHQVLVNLLNNATKFTEKGYVKLQVQGNQGGTGFIEIVFRIEDTGIGIHPDNLKRIFDRFEQVDNGSFAKVEGTGLGLFISKSLTGLMGGTLSVESTLGVGSVFTVNLVQRICSENVITGVPTIYSDKMERKPELNLFAPKARILSVDDNMINNGVFYEFCKRFGIEAILADSGAKAIEILKNETFDIVFLDQMMPGMDGIETLEMIQQLPNLNPDMTILALTANAIRGNTEFLLSKGFEDVIMKPIGILELEDVLNYYLPDELKRNRDDMVSYSHSVHKKNEVEDESVLEEYAPTNDVVNEEKQQDLIEYEVGLKHCNHDMDLYKQTLKMLIEYLPSRLDQMDEFIRQKEFDSYVIEVHALKNNAALIGAVKLSEEAKKLEMAGREGDYEMVTLNAPKLHEQYRFLIGQIQKDIDRNNLI